MRAPTTAVGLAAIGRPTATKAKGDGQKAAEVR